MQKMIKLYKYLIFITIRFMELAMSKYKRFNLMDMSLCDAASYSFNLGLSIISLAIWLLIMHAVGKVVVISVLWEIYGYIPVYFVVMLLNNITQKKISDYNQLKQFFCNVEDKQVVVSFFCWMAFCFLFLFATMYFHWSIH